MVLLNSKDIYYIHYMFFFHFVLSDILRDMPITWLCTSSRDFWQIQQQHEVDLYAFWTYGVYNIYIIHSGLTRCTIFILYIPDRWRVPYLLYIFWTDDVYYIYGYIFWTDDVYLPYLWYTFWTYYVYYIYLMRINQTILRQGFIVLI